MLRCLCLNVLDFISGKLISVSIIKIREILKLLHKENQIIRCFILNAPILVSCDCFITESKNPGESDL